MGIPVAQRLRKQSDFQRVRSSEHRIHCGPFIVQCDMAVESSLRWPMLGVIASRRVGNAVKRNRGKRLIREIFRRNAAALPGACRLVVVLRSGYDRHSFADLEARFLKASATLSKEAGREEFPS